MTVHNDTGGMGMIVAYYKNDTSRNSLPKWKPGKLPLANIFGRWKQQQCTIFCTLWQYSNNENKDFSAQWAQEKSSFITGTNSPWLFNILALNVFKIYINNADTLHTLCSQNEYNIRSLSKEYFREQPIQYVFHRKLLQIKYASSSCCKEGLSYACNEAIFRITLITHTLIHSTYFLETCLPVLMICFRHKVETCNALADMQLWTSLPLRINCSPVPDEITT
jgi:hypothetical protein